MSLQGWPWWRWLVISLVVGALVGWSLTNREPDDPSLPSTSLMSFMRKLHLRTDNGEPVLTKIRVGPLVPDNTGKKVQVVTFWERMKNRQTGSWDPVTQYRLYTSVPVFPKAPRADYGILDYLADQKQQMPTLDAGFSWWQVPRNAWIVAMGGSVLLIGILWPLTVRMLVRMGLGNPELPADAGVDLSKVTTKPLAGVVAPRDISADEQAQLDALNERLEKSVGQMLIDADGLDEAKERKAEQKVIRQLNNTKLEVEEPNATPQQQTNFDGEYYPVARPVTKNE